MKLFLLVLVVVIQDAATCKFCPIQKKGCHGHDMESMTAKTVCACKERCNENANCTAISFYKTDVKPTNNCYLKNYQCSIKELVNTTGTYMIKIECGKDCEKELAKLSAVYCEREGKGCAGHDIEFAREPSLKACQRRCNDNERCKSISFYEDRIGGSSLNCFVKDYVCTDAELRNTTGAYYVRVNDTQNCQEVLRDLKQAHYQYCERAHKGCVGHDTESTRESSLKDCQRRCSENERCKAISFFEEKIQAGTVNCYVKDYVCRDSELTTTTGAYYVKVGKGQTCKP